MVHSHVFVNDKYIFLIFKGATGGEILCVKLLGHKPNIIPKSELMLGGHCKQSRYRWMVVNEVLCLGVEINYTLELNNQLKM